MQKIINILVVVLFGVTLYYTIIVDYQRSTAIDELSASDIELQGHRSMIDTEYERLNNKFIGRGKHMQRIQTSLKDLNNRLSVVADSLGNKIEENAYFLKRLEEQLSDDIRRVQGEITGLSDELSTYKRRTNRSILDIQEQISTLQSDLSALEEKVEPPEDGKK